MKKFWGVINLAWQISFVRIPGVRFTMHFPWGKKFTKTSFSARETSASFSKSKLYNIYVHIHLPELARILYAFLVGLIMRIVIKVIHIIFCALWTANIILVVSCKVTDSIWDAVRSRRLPPLFCIVRWLLPPLYVLRRECLLLPL